MLTAPLDKAQASVLIFQNQASPGNVVPQVRLEQWFPTGGALNGLNYGQGVTGVVQNIGGVNYYVQDSFRYGIGFGVTADTGPTPNIDVIYDLRPELAGAARNVLNSTDLGTPRGPQYGVLDPAIWWQHNNASWTSKPVADRPGLLLIFWSRSYEG